MYFLPKHWHFMSLPSFWYHNVYYLQHLIIDIIHYVTYFWHAWDMQCYEILKSFSFSCVMHCTFSINMFIVICRSLFVYFIKNICFNYGLWHWNLEYLMKTKKLLIKLFFKLDFDTPPLLQVFIVTKCCSYHPLM